MLGAQKNKPPGGGLWLQWLAGRTHGLAELGRFARQSPSPEAPGLRQPCNTRRGVACAGSVLRTVCVRAQPSFSLIRADLPERWRR